MLILKSLTLENIGRFTESQTIDFTQLGSLVQVDGQNNNTGGSSGAGKSTIFKALEFLLGLNDISNGVLQSRLTKEAMSVVGNFELDGQPLKIERGKKLLIELNGEVTTGSSKLTEEKLDQIIGMPRDLFRKILHKRQGEGGFFLDFGPSETHKFLTSCLGLEKEQAKIAVLDSRLSTLTSEDASIKSAISALQSTSEATQNAIASLGSPPALDFPMEALEGLKNKHLSAIDAHSKVRDGLKLEVEALEKSRPQVTVSLFDRTNIERIEGEINNILVEISKLERVELDRQSTVKSKISDLRLEASRLAASEQARQANAKSRISELQIIIRDMEKSETERQAELRAKININNISILIAKSESSEGTKAKDIGIGLAKELQKIKASVCPTCEQGWVTEAAKTKEAEILEKLQGYKKLVIAGMAADTKILSLEKDKVQLQSELEPLPPSIQHLEFLEEIKVLEADSKPKAIPELEPIRIQMEQIGIEALPQAIPEAIELKLKKDFKDKELSALRQEERDHQSKENAKNQALLTEFAQKQSALRLSHQSTVKYVQDEENSASAAYEAAKNSIKFYMEAKKRYDESRNKLEDQALKCADQMTVEALRLGSTAEETELATESKKAINSYLSCSFEDALDSIGDAATRLIRAIPNMATATIQFEGLKETKEGKVKEEVTCLISMDGEIGIPVKSLSGGERSSTDLAIDLAVIKFIEERTGKGIDLMILDEPFTGLDTTNVFEALEMLKECSSDKRLMIVDHNPVAAQSIESRITVTRTGLTSKVMQR